MLSIIFSGIGLVVAGFLTLWIISLRRVVRTNMVNIVQSAKATISYGAGQTAGNVYYEWPKWLPKIGVTVIRLPVSNFNLSFDGYKAYDIDRVPFVVDITAFFKIVDTNYAAQNLESFNQMRDQLMEVVQGAVRTILANSTIDDIMIKRAEFGKAFTKEVGDNVKAWGVETVKDLELMDIRDTGDSKVIQNIMAKKKSFIEMESRTEVAKNNKTAEIAEIEAQKESALKNEAALQSVGERTAEKDKMVGVANEQALQEVKEQQKVTKTKEMAVLKVQEVETANILKEVNVVKANEDKETDVITAEGEKQKTVIIAEGNLEETKKDAEGILAKGTAEAEAERLMLQAPVDTQISLAKEIGENQGYQSYLINVEAIKANQAVGMEQAQALQNSDLKVIANSGDVTSGVSNLMDLLTPAGGTSIAGMAEAFSQTEQGAAILSRLGVSTSPADHAPV